MGPLPRLLLLTRLASALGDPLATRNRPPQQTQVQYDAKNQLVGDAKTASQNARDWLWNYLNNEVRSALQDTWLKDMSADDLLQRLDWEFNHMIVIHNGPLDESDQTTIQDDTNLEMNMQNGFLENVCQRWVFGTNSQTEYNLVGEHDIMTQFMKLPFWARGPNEPTLREANSCVMYLATNLRKTHCGNFQFGSVTYVINNIYQDKWAVAPFDTGTFWQDHKDSMVFGTLQDYYHVLMHHIQVLNYNFAEMFKRWYVEGTPPPDVGEFPYMEIDWFGNAWFPESILYVVVKYATNGGGVGMFGTDSGRNLQNKMRYRGRPVIWADGDNSGMLIDGTVNMIEGGRIDQADSDYFNQHWGQNTPWEDFYGYSPEHLKFFLPQYDRKEICQDLEWDTKKTHMIMGHDRLGNCVYWEWPHYPSKYECLNDGTCELSDRDSAVFNSMEDCLRGCAHGKWECVENDPMARQGAHHCRPSQNSGMCSDLDTCETHCGGGFTCSRLSTPGNSSAPSWMTQAYV